MRSSFLGKALSRADKLTNDQLRALFNELVVSNDRLEAAIQSMFDGIVVCNLNHEPVLINKSAERILRIQGGWGGGPFWMALADEELKDFFYKSLTSEETILGREFALQSSGGTRIIAISLSALLSGDRIAGTIIHIEDITEKRKKETQLRRAESLAALTTLAAGVAHEINNPLGSISIRIQLLEKLLKAENTDKAAMNKHLNVVKEEMERLKQIVVDFLFAVRPMDIQLLSENPAQIVEEIAELIQPEADRKGIDVKMTLGADLPRVLMDKRHIKQALLNLIQNAMAAMPDGGDLGIAVEASNDELMISVSDTGTGIPEDMLTKIFEPYFTTKKSGTGLGLTITFKIIKEHSGDISLESKEGVGSTFTIHLPIPQKEKKSLPQWQDSVAIAGSQAED
ncbi:MAG TPA: ATP-binding protein [Rectinemataceae bacterium]|nr:ATP-binding protein [Rectinemataceae bacterium]